MFHGMNSTNLLLFCFVHVAAEHLVSPLSCLDGLRHSVDDDLVMLRKTGQDSRKESRQ